MIKKIVFKKKSNKKVLQNNNIDSIITKDSFLSKILLPLSLVYVLVYSILKYRFFKPALICNKTICFDSLAVNMPNKMTLCDDLCDYLIKENNNICFVTVEKDRKVKRDFIVPKNHYFIFGKNEVGKKTLLLCKKLDVFVVNNRAKANAKSYDIAICDDCFYDNTIKKDCNIIALNGDSFIGNGRTIPSGKLKYRLKSLKKAQFVIITDVKNDKFEKQRDFLSKFIDKNRILMASIICDNSYDKNLNYIVLTKTTNSDVFFNIIKEHGFNVRKFISIRKNQKYNNKFLNFLKLQFQSLKADKIMIFRQDLVEIPKYFFDFLPFVVFDFHYKIDNINEIISFVFNDQNKRL